MHDGGEAATSPRNNRGFGLRKQVVVSRLSGNVTPTCSTFFTWRLEESMSRTNGTEQRRRFTPDEKATNLRRHLVDKVAVSDLCDEYQIQPNVFFLWHARPSSA